MTDEERMALRIRLDRARGKDVGYRHEGHTFPQQFHKCTRCGKGQGRFETPCFIEPSDPLTNAQDCEALIEFMVGQGWEYQNTGFRGINGKDVYETAIWNDGADTFKACTSSWKEAFCLAADAALQAEKEQGNG